MKRVLEIYIYLMTMGAAFVIQGCGSATAFGANSLEWI